MHQLHIFLGYAESKSTSNFVIFIDKDLYLVCIEFNEILTVFTNAPPEIHIVIVRIYITESMAPLLNIIKIKKHVNINYVSISKKNWERLF